MLVQQITGKRGVLVRQQENGAVLGTPRPLPSAGKTRILEGSEKRTPNQARQRSREWASLFSGKLFVMLVAYADESETAGFGAFGGYVASVDQWSQFTSEWQRILNEYDASFFHFREWAMASAVVRKKRAANSSFYKGPYCGWKLKKLDSFLLELGQVAGILKKGTFGGYISIEEFNRRKVAADGILIGEKHRDYCLRRCFEAFIDALNTVWPRYAESVSFFWDITQDISWKQSIIAAYEPFRKNNFNFNELEFADDKTRLPLQVADMVAYRMRQRSEKFSKNEKQIMLNLDKAMFPAGGGHLALNKVNLIPNRLI